MTKFKAGDMALSKNPSTWYATIICWVTRGRYSHVRLVVNNTGDTLEAVSGGVRPGHVLDRDVVLRPPLTKEQREMIPGVAEAFLGTPYGWRDVIILGLAQLGIRLPFGAKELLKDPDRLFCSQYFDLVLRLVGYRIFVDRRLPRNVSPADLADRALRSGWEVIQGGASIATSASGGALGKVKGLPE